MQVAIISDTHMPSRASSILEWVQDAVRGADHTIHVGDFDSPEGYEAVMDVVDEDVTAVKGNMDPVDLGLPEVATVELGGVAFVAIHGTGRRTSKGISSSSPTPPGRRAARTRSARTRSASVATRTASWTRNTTGCGS